MPRQPHEFPRRVLLCVTGMAPQVVTETLYALLIREPRFVPTEVHIITTREGARQASLSLLEPDTNWFGRLLEDSGIARESVAFDESHIHVVQNHHAQNLDDIRTPEENTAAADQITRFVARLASDPDCAIHASLAGGRKTLGYYLGYAMSLFGRPQDKLSHVLVSEPFEYLKTFFFPPKRGLVLYLNDGTPVHTRTATVDLAEIPFVNLSDALPRPLRKRLDDPAFSFRSVVEEAQLALEPPLLRIDLDDQLVLLTPRAIELKLTPTDFVFYALIAQRTQQNKGTNRQDLPVAELKAMADRCSVTLKTDLDSGDSSETGRIWFDQRKTHINAILQERGFGASSPYRIEKTGGRRFSLNIPPDRIEIMQFGSSGVG
jgi:CRISPR-associated protein, NE0113 family